ncbi:hypothetical protein [Aquimarina spongiae]|uniref:Uncharacterized protein n=1 Tax=Aquimarina spongiae TaxID=570521 RepID=A0A1M6I0R2_9FLAO|nr:hypothetical protein [Aquimarina spongiae]SHJ28001.1 hypothetical protein SAMN04488508_10737 [Aquimarina spongiae]
MIESSAFRAATWKFSGVVFGTILIAFSILKYYNPESTTDWTKLTVISSIGIVLMILNFFYFDKIKKVKIDHSKIIYQEKGVEKVVPWNEVSSVYRVWSFSKPMYGARIHGKSFIFPTESVFSLMSVSIGSYTATYDHSQMGAVIKKVKATYHI